MIYFVLLPVLLIAANAAVINRAIPDECFEDIEMSVWNDGPTVTGDAGIGAEFETPLVNFQNSDCNLEDTFATKRKLVEGRSGKNFDLTVDTGSLELGAGKLNPEYILDGRNIKVGDGSAATAGKAASESWTNWTPWKDNPANQIKLIDYPKCNPWTVTGIKEDTKLGDTLWVPQVTAPMPLAALYSLMKENVKDVKDGRNILNGQWSHSTGQNLQLVTKEYFQSSSLKIDPNTVNDDMLGFCTLVLSYAKAASKELAPDVSAKHWLTFMPRTEFNTIYAQVSSKFTIPLFDVFNTLACYKTDSNEQVTIDTDYCKGTTASPEPGTKLAGLQYKFNGDGFPDPTNPQTVNIKDWIQNIGIKDPKPDSLTAFDKNYDSSIGGLNTATERVFNSQRAVPLFEFRDLNPVKTSEFETFMKNVDDSIQDLHKKFAAPPTKKIRKRAANCVPTAGTACATVADCPKDFCPVSTDPLAKIFTFCTDGACKCVTQIS